MSEQLTVPRGTRDLLPGGEQEHIDRTRYAVRTRLVAAGFRQVETPVFEALALFTTKAGEGIVDQLYTFRDKGGRDLALRSDITPALTRVLLNHGLGWPRPIRLLADDRVWRYEAPQSGRFREIRQINAEMFGAAGILADAEIAALLCECLDAVGLIDYEIHVGSRRLLTSLIEQLGVPQYREAEAVRLLDKADKISEEDLVRSLTAIVGEVCAADRLAQVALLSGPIEQISDAVSALCPGTEVEASVHEIQALAAVVPPSARGRLVFRPGLARGFDYYTGVLYEVVTPHLQWAVGGGGRYDGLVESFGGPSMPAVGFSIGIDRLCLALAETGSLSEPATGSLLFMSDAASPVLIHEWSVALRDSGALVEVLHDKRPFSKGCDAARRRGRRFGISLDTSRGTASVRDLSLGQTSDDCDLGRTCRIVGQG